MTNAEKAIKLSEQCPCPATELAAYSCPDIAKYLVILACPHCGKITGYTGSGPFLREKKTRCRHCHVHVIVTIEGPTFIINAKQFGDFGREHEVLC